MNAFIFSIHRYFFIYSLRWDFLVPVHHHLVNLLPVLAVLVRPDGRVELLQVHAGDVSAAPYRH